MSKLLIVLLLITLSMSCRRSDSDSSSAAPGGPVSNFVDPAGVLDSTFAASGLFLSTANAGESASFVRTQSTGKIIVASRTGSTWYFRRLSADGVLDTSFGTAGVATITDNQFMFDFFIDSNDKLMPMHRTKIYRLNEDGSVDTTFGTAGSVVPGFQAYRIIEDSVGNYFLAETGVRIQKLSSVGVILATYTPFATTGHFYSITIDADDNLYPVGLDTTAWKGLAGKVKPDGTADTTFGTNGWVTFTMAGGYADTKSVQLMSDGSLVVSGNLDAVSDMFIAKITSAGVLDTSFGNAGFASGGYSGTTTQGWFQGWKVDVLENDKILVAGTDGNDAVIAKYLEDGTLDTGFGTSGVLAVDNSGGVEIAQHFSINSDGSILMTGYSSNGVIVSKIK